MMFRAAAEHVCRRVRTVLSAVGAFWDTLIPGPVPGRADAIKCSYCPTEDGTACSLDCDCEVRAYFRELSDECEAKEEVADPCDWSQVWRAVGCPECHSIAGLACSDEQDFRRPELPPHNARIAAFQDSAASATADCSAEVSADRLPAPSAEHPTSAGPPAAEDDPAGTLPPLPVGSPTSVAVVNIDHLIAIAAEFMAGHGRHEHFSADGERLWRCSRLCGLENLTAAEHDRHVSEIVVPALVFELSAAARPASFACRAADDRVTEQLGDAGFQTRVDSNVSTAREVFPQHTKRHTE